MSFVVKNLQRRIQVDLIWLQRLDSAWYQSEKLCRALTPFVSKYFYVSASLNARGVKLLQIHLFRVSYCCVRVCVCEQVHMCVCAVDYFIWWICLSAPRYRHYNSVWQAALCSFIVRSYVAVGANRIFLIIPKYECEHIRSSRSLPFRGSAVSYLTVNTCKGKT